MARAQTAAQARWNTALRLGFLLSYLSLSHGRNAFNHGRAEYIALHSRAAGPTTLTNGTKNPAETGIANVLVLGSTGLIGSSITAVLAQAGYTVHQVRHRYDVDLRLPGALQQQFKGKPIDFAFFLACEDGGAPERVWDHNLAMYASVLPFLEERRVPFLFASSARSALNSTFGRMKREGERRVLAGGVGRVAKLWNVYGYEKVGLRRRFLVDWLHACAAGRRVVHSVTDGHERKQLVYVDDLARSLVDMMAAFQSLPPVTDVTTGAWVSMRQVAGIVTRATGGACRIQFARDRAPVPAEPEPANLWEVKQNMEAGLRHMLARYRSDVTKDAAWRTRDEVYLSIVVASTNDDYNGIRARMFASTHHLAAAARKVGLDYELIIMQYNPHVNTDYFGKPHNASTGDELPLSQLLPLTAESAEARLRIITVPPDLHRHADKGKLWEFHAKNAGIRRARGKFVLLTNMDDMFPRELLGWIAKENMQADMVLRAHTILNFSPAQASDMQGACDAAAASLTVLSDTPGKSCDSAVSGASTAVGTLAASGWASGGTPYDVRNCFMGDFSVWSRDAFIRTGGYVETYQNIHLETAHRQYAAQLAGSPIKHWRFADQPICHQAHERRGRPAAPFSPSALVQQHKSRTDNATWGFAEKNLPIATAASVLDRGYNPSTPYALYQHHPVFESFPISQAPFDPAYLVDFVGTKTLYEYDCGDWEAASPAGGPRVRLSRRISCGRHDAFRVMGVGLTGIPVLGDLPVMDEEYFEWVSLLQAVDAYAEASPPRPFVVAEFGARYGTWAARGARAVRSKAPDALVDACVVESDPTSYARMLTHLERNVPPSTHHFFMLGVIANRSGEKVLAMAAEATDKGQHQTVSTVSVADALAKYVTVDIVHMDVRVAEAVCLAADTMGVLKAKVKALHFATHTPDAHHRLRAGFVAAGGWSVTHDVSRNGGASPGRVEQTDFGPITYYGGGGLRVINMGLEGF